MGEKNWQIDAQPLSQLFKRVYLDKVQAGHGTYW